MTNLSELPNRTHRAAVSVAALSMVCGVVALAAPTANAAPIDQPNAGDWQVIAHGLVELDAGDRQWTIDEVAVAGDAPIELEFAGPSFVVGAAGATIVEGDTLAARVLTGEATFHPSDGTASLTPASSGAAGVTTIALDGIQADNSSVAIPLLAGRYDIDLVRDVIPAGEESLLSSALPVLVLVTDGSVTDALGDAFEIGQSSTLEGDVVLTAPDDAAATVIAAIVTPVPHVEATDNAVATPTSAASATTAPPTPTTTAPTPATTAPAPASTVPADSDMDGLTDAEEAALGTNPLNNDSDADFLYDADEVNMWNSDPNDPDSDGDGLLDGDEANVHGSSPNASDTDGDGVSDYDEAINLRSNPNDVDSDGDGLDDYVEWTAYGTNPTAADTDGDLDNDGYEVSMGTNPLDATDFTT